MESKKFLRSALGIATFCILLYWGLQNMDRVATFLGMVGGLLLPFLLGAAMAFILNVPMRAIETHLPQKLQRAHRGISLCVYPGGGGRGSNGGVASGFAPAEKHRADHRSPDARLLGTGAAVGQRADDPLPELADWLSEAGNLKPGAM